MSVPSGAVKDLRHGRVPLRVRVVGRRLRCLEVDCPRWSFTQTCGELPLRARLTERLRVAAQQAVTRSNRAVCDVAAEYGLSWPTVHRTLIAAAAALLPPPASTTAIGVDETRARSVRWLLGEHGWRRSDPWMTSIVDLDPAHQRGLIGLAPGRSGACIQGWIDQQSQAFRDAVQVVEHCCVVRAVARETAPMSVSLSSSPVGFRFPREVIVVAVRWYLRYGLSYRDVEELLAERGVTVDHVTVYRWVQRFTPDLVHAARSARRAPGDRWFVDETYVKVSGRWSYLYRAVDQHGQVIDVMLCAHRDLDAARRFFVWALRVGARPVEVTTDRAASYPRVLDELVPTAMHTVEQYTNNPVECDHGRLKARLRPMRGLKRHRSARTVAAGHAFVQNIRRGHYEIATETPKTLRLAAAFTELAAAI